MGDRRLIRHMLTLMVVSIFLLAVAACTWVSLSREKDCVDDLYGLTIAPPPSAEILEESCYLESVPVYRLTFRMAPSDLEAFQAATPVTTWGTDVSRLLAFKDEADRAAICLAGYYIDGARQIEVLIDMSDARQYTVYYKARFVD